METSIKYPWLLKQDEDFIHKVCGDYAQDMIDLIEVYRAAILKDLTTVLRKRKNQYWDGIYIEEKEKA